MPETSAMMDQMMTERFTIFTFSRPIPFAERQAGWKACGRCAARFYLDGACATVADATPGHLASEMSAGGDQQMADASSGVAMRSEASAAALPKVETESPRSSLQPEQYRTDAASVVDALQRLADLRGAGMLTEDEYAAAKRRVLGV